MAKDWRRSPEAARRHWKQREAGQTSKASRGVQRLVFTALSIGLIALLIWWVYLRGQKVYFAYLAEDYGPMLVNPAKVEVATLAPSVALSQPTYQHEFSPLEEHIYDQEFQVANLAPGGSSKLAARKLVESLTAPLRDKWELGEVEFMMLYVHAHGIALDGTPYLLWNEDYATELARPIDGQTKPALMTLDDLLEQVRGLKSEYKILLLDSGQMTADPRLGMFVNEFPRLVEQAVAATGDKSLYVITSNAPLERSHVLAANHRSVFGHVVAQAMTGAPRADALSDMTFAQFGEYIAKEVSNTVATKTGHSQTPQFIVGNKGVVAPSSLPDVALLKHEFFKPGAHAAAHRAPSRHYAASQLPAPSDNDAKAHSSGNTAASLPAALAVAVLAQDGAADKPATDKPATDKPAAEKPAADKPADAPKPAADKPATDKPAADKPAADKPADKPAADKPADKPATDKPATDKPTDGADKPAAPAADKPAEPVADKPASSDAPKTDAAADAADAPAKPKGKNKTPPPLDFGEIWKQMSAIEDPDANPGSWSPVDYAPHLWAQLRRQIAWYEWQYLLEGDNVQANSEFLKRDILKPLGGLLLSKDGKEDDGSAESGVDVFGQLAAARSVFRNSTAMNSVPERGERGIQQFIAAVRLRNYLLFRVAEQVRNYGVVNDPNRVRYAAIDHAIGELAVVSRQMEVELNQPLAPTWASDAPLLTRLRLLRTTLDVQPDLLRGAIRAGEVPETTTQTFVRPTRPAVTDAQPALWADLYLKLTRLSTLDGAEGTPDDVATVSAFGKPDSGLTELAGQIRRIVAGDAARAEEDVYWRAYRAVGKQVRSYYYGISRGLHPADAGGRPDAATLSNMERQLRLVDGRDAPAVALVDNVIARRRLVPQVEPQVRFQLAETKIGLPPGGGKTAQKKITGTYTWDGEPGASATMSVELVNPQGGSEVVSIVNPSSAQFTLAARGALPEVFVQQSPKRAGKSSTDVAAVRVSVVVNDAGRKRGSSSEVTVEAFGRESVELKVYQVAEGFPDVPIDSAAEGEGGRELAEPAVTEGKVKARFFEYRVRPFPNRSAQYRLTLQNLAGADAERNVIVDLFAARSTPGQKLDVINARGELDPKYVRPMPQFRRELTLASGKPVVFPFEAPPPKKPKEGEAAAAPPAEPPPAPDAKPKGPPQPIADFRDGLVMRIRDQANDALVWYYWIDIRARRPDEYTESVVTYDRTLGKLDIEVRARAGVTQPPDGIKAKWETVGTDINIAGLPGTQEVKKKSPGPIRLSVRDWYPTEPRAGEPAIPLFINIDDYPRAFVHNFTPNIGAGTRIPAADKYRRVKIVDPRNLMAYLVKDEEPVHVKVGLQIDAGGSDFGMVTFGDGNNQPVTLTSWRAEHIYLFEKGWDKDGVLTLKSLVNDYVDADALAFDTTLTDSLIPIKAELRSGGATIDSHSIDVVADNTVPELALSDPSPLNAIEKKVQTTAVTASVFDAGGIAKINFFIFDKTKQRLTEADQKEPRFQWPPKETDPPLMKRQDVVVQIPIEKLGPGEWVIWAVAVDQVEKKSVPQRCPNPVAIVEAPKDAPEEKGVITITGKALYGDKPLISGTVTLTPIEGTKGEPETQPITPKQAFPTARPRDAVIEGVYTFEGVAPGKYKISATGKTDKSPYTFVGEVPSVEVKKGEKGVKPVDIKMSKQGR